MAIFRLVNDRSKSTELMKSIVMSVWDRRSTLIGINLIILVCVTSCDRDKGANDANGLESPAERSTTSDQRPGARVVATNEPSGSRFNEEKFTSLIGHDYGAAYDYFMDLKANGLLSDQELARIASTLFVAVDASGRRICAERAVRIYDLLEPMRKVVMSGDLMDLIYHGFGEEKAIAFYMGMDPGEARVRAVTVLSRNMTGSWDAINLLAFIDGLEYPEERRAAAGVLDTDFLLGDIGNDHTEAYRLMAGVDGVELRDAILTGFLRQVDPTGMGSELAGWLSRLDIEVDRDAMETAWVQFFTREDIPVEDMIGLLEFSTANERSHDNAQSHLANNLVGRSIGEVHELLSALEREEQIAVTSRIPPRSNDANSLAMVAMLPDNELRDIYLANCARHYAVAMRSMDHNPYLPEMSSNEFRSKTFEDIEALLKLLEETDH